MAAAMEQAHTKSATRIVALRGGANSPKLRKSPVSQKTRTIRKGFGS